MSSVRSGLLAVDKPAGVSSRDCVNHVQRLLGKRHKIGHAGTLDPLATGVLLLVLGEATRLVEQLHELDKRYVADFEFGKQSDTLDREGQVEISKHVQIPEPESLEAACVKWTGPSVLQQPPRYSAIKVQGQRAYDMARRGQEFELAARPVAIYSMRVLSYRYPHWRVEIHCGSGTYVRSIGRDVAHAVGNTAIMNELVRTAVGPFEQSNAIALDKISSVDDIQSNLQSPILGLPHWHRAVVSQHQIKALRQGQKIMLNAEQFKPPEASDRWLAIDDHGQLIALLEAHATGYARPARVFQTAMATSQPISINARQSPESL